MFYRYMVATKDLLSPQSPESSQSFLCSNFSLRKKNLNSEIHIIHRYYITPFFPFITSSVYLLIVDNENNIIYQNGSHDTAGKNILW